LVGWWADSATQRCETNQPRHRLGQRGRTGIVAAPTASHPPHTRRAFLSSVARMTGLPKGVVASQWLICSRPGSSVQSSLFPPGRNGAPPTGGGKGLSPSMKSSRVHPRSSRCRSCPTACRCQARRSCCRRRDHRRPCLHPAHRRVDFLPNPISWSSSGPPASASSPPRPARTSPPLSRSSLLPFEARKGAESGSSAISSSSPALPRRRCFRPHHR